MYKFQGEKEVSAVGCMSDPLFKSWAFSRATQCLTFDQKNTLISLILQDRNKAIENALAQERRQKGK